MDSILQNEELMQKLACCGTVDELNNVLEANNIVLQEGITAQQFLNVMNGESYDELGEDDLADVSGGIMVPVIIPGIVIIGLGVARSIYKLCKKRK